jgi:hypothetical protein
MPLNEQQVAIRFAGGIETKMDEKAVPAAKLLVLENGVFTKAISISKRNGYTSRSRDVDGSGTALDGMLALGRRDEELLAFTASRCYSYQADADAWQDAGACVAALATDRPAVKTGTQQTSPDHATNGGISVFAWEDSRGGVWCTVEDATSGRVCLVPNQLDALGIMPRCIPVGNMLHVYWIRTSAGPSWEIHVAVINPTVPSTTPFTAILTYDASPTNTVYDACQTNFDTGAALMVWAEAATTNFRLGFVDPSGVLGSPATGYPSVITEGSINAASPIACAYIDDVAAVVAEKLDGNTYLFRYDSGLVGGVLAPSLLTGVVGQRATAVFDAVGLLWFAVDESGAIPSQNRTYTGSYNTATGTVTTRTIRSVSLASRAFANTGGDAFAVFVHDTTYFNTYVTFRLGDYAPTGARSRPRAALPARTHVPPYMSPEQSPRCACPTASACSARTTTSSPRPAFASSRSTSTAKTATSPPSSAAGSTSPARARCTTTGARGPSTASTSGPS